MKFSPYGSPIPLVFTRMFHKFHPEILTASPCPEQGRQTREVWENKPVSSFMHQYRENGRRYVQSYY